MASQTDRDKRLDQLVALTQQWSAQRQKELNDRVASLTRILQGRGAGQLLNAQQEAATALVATEIDNFLTG
jgi:hypothetical protein